MKTLLSVLVVAVLALAGAAVWGWWQYERRPLPMAAAEVEVEIERGGGANRVAESLNRQGLRVSPWLFRLAVRLREDDARLRAGIYLFDSPVTLRRLIDRLTRGDATQHAITFIDGWTFRQMREAIARTPELRQDSRELSDLEILQRIGATETHPEGLFAPDTYAFDRNSSELKVLRQAYRLQQRRLQQAWERAQASTPPLPYATPYEVLIMASIIEKETGRPDERPKVAAVFVNRLQRGMMLQSDPTTIYGLGDAFDGNLRRRHLQTDTVYNTYTRGGLPPTPIAMPGRAAIEAAVAPAAIDALYFVSRGDGTSEFSNDLAAHNRAVNKYQRRQGLN
ncbi:MAG TPA: endolytic transglycosylase MltG [Burkholderiaceae bacterium]|nr:endolytic transglycosylase MltG [Burkholderiaceae bacterium]